MGKAAAWGVLLSALLFAAPVLATPPVPPHADRAGPAALPTNPGDWVRPEDYPPIALRLDMAGVTEFAISIDAAGAPAACEITHSSGFDVLDRATCRALMARARFRPARNSKGEPVASIWRSRSRWTLPDDRGQDVVEGAGRADFMVDAEGGLQSCKGEAGVLGQRMSTDDFCGPVERLSAPTRLAMRGSEAVAPVEMRVELANAFSEAARDIVLAPTSGYELRSLMVVRVTVDRAGKSVSCVFEQQRADERFVHDYCRDARSATFRVPASAIGTDGTAQVWHIERILRKVG